MVGRYEAIWELTCGLFGTGRKNIDKANDRQLKGH